MFSLCPLQQKSGEDIPQVGGVLSPDLSSSSVPQKNTKSRLFKSGGPATNSPGKVATIE